MENADYGYPEYVLANPQCLDQYFTEETHVRRKACPGMQTGPYFKNCQDSLRSRVEGIDKCAGGD